jgi:hypothetical protein
MTTQNNNSSLPTEFETSLQGLLQNANSIIHEYEQGTWISKDQSSTNAKQVQRTYEFCKNLMVDYTSNFEQDIGVSAPSLVTQT